MLIAEAYCEVLHVSRQAFSALTRQFPILQEVLMETNESRHEHAVFTMGSEEEVGDWIRPRSCYKFHEGWSGVVPEEVLQRSELRKKALEEEKAAAKERKMEKSMSWAANDSRAFAASAAG
jgi:hypothetical protein